MSVLTISTLFCRLGLLCAALITTCALLPQTACGGEKPYVVFLNPAAKDDVFFGQMETFAQAAAEDLGFELVTYHGDRQHILIDENVETLFKQKRLPQYILGMNARGSGKNLLEKAEASGIKTIFVNQSFLDADREKMGIPGERYKFWLFEYLPDDIHAGYQLAKALIDEALAKKLTDKNGVVHILGINGHEASTASVLRKKGLEKAVKEYPNVKLHQIAHADWKRDRARELSKRLLSRYSDVTVIWSASDKMALGVCEGIRGSGKKTGKDILTGGVDWAKVALDRVDSGEFTASTGGHFMDGAWGLVMLYDAIHGKTPPRTSQSHFSTITAKNIDLYQKHFADKDMRDIDFTKFSKHLNPSLKQYDFSLDAVLKQLKRQK